MSLGLREECAGSVGVNGFLKYLAIKNPDLFELIAPRLRGERLHCGSVSVPSLFLSPYILLRCKPFLYFTVIFIYSYSLQSFFLSLPSSLSSPLFPRFVSLFSPFLMEHFFLSYVFISLLMRFYFISSLFRLLLSFLACVYSSFFYHQFCYHFLAISMFTVFFLLSML